MRVVFDANILVSALISGQGNPAQIFSRFRQEGFELAISLPILEEVHRVSYYPRIQKKYKLTEEAIDKFLKLNRLITCLARDLSLSAGKSS